eukprot:scaffold1229_cov193-Alexandrium_tamarense.AAC.12
MEESRRRLMPLVALLEDDEDDTVPQDYTDGRIAQEFLQCIEGVFGAVDVLMMRLADAGMISLDSNDAHNHDHQTNSNGEEESVYLLMASNCISKARDFIARHFLKLVEADSISLPSGPLDDNEVDAEEDIRIQPAMARLVELALRIVHIQSLVPASENSNHANYNDDDDDEEDVTCPTVLIEAYAQYQRRCLRARSKPAITFLAELRSVASSQKCFVSDILEEEHRRQQVESGLHDDDDDEHDNEGDDGGGTNTSRGQPHSQAVTVVLGEASSLIQPLAAWRDAIVPSSDRNDITNLLQQLCQESMNTLDIEAQTLAGTVGSWFGSDQRGISSLEQSPNVRSSQQAMDLASMESSLDEMAFLCQVLSRYCLFSQQTVVREGGSSSISDSTKLHNLLTEQSLHYSTLETRLAALQFNQAVSLASPQLIELGRPSLQVPSIVEDAHFVCVRAIERAAGTRSERAVWTVGHWVCEVWGVDESSDMGEEGVKGVYRALMQGVGCSGGASVERTEPDNTIASGSPAKVGNSFTAALLEAVDGDIDEDGLVGNNSAPTSGGILWDKISRGTKLTQESLQSKVDSELCALNGIYAAENACSALSGLFNELVEERLEGDAIAHGGNQKKASMLTFARDELASHSRAYHNLLQHRVRSLVSDLCGADDIFDTAGRLCLQNLRLFVENEVYNLNASSFRTMEGEDRLEAEMLGPIRRSQILDEIGKDKCDSVVVLQMVEAMSLKSAEIILKILFQGSKEFNEWGALLLGKQVRMLTNTYCGIVLGSDNSSKDSQSTMTPKSGSSTAAILKQFERINQAVSILQLEKPSDWLAFAYQVGDSDDTNLTTDEIRKVMELRVDFSADSIAKVCSKIK